MIDDLLAFLRARLDEDEQTAQRATARQRGGGSWTCHDSGVYDASGLTVVKRLVPVHQEHIARHDPARVLAEVGAERLIIAPYVAALEERAPLRERMRAVIETDADAFGRLHRQESELIETERRFRPAVQALALPYAGHPDYREEWRP